MDGPWFGLSAEPAECCDIGQYAHVVVSFIFGVLIVLSMVKAIVRN
jgi:hypothetical protein